jgi:hypothetical protein
MKIIKRLFWGIAFLILTLLVPFEAIIYSVVWIISGKNLFDNPLCSHVFNEIDKI